jgi:uncharacterized protein (TIGR02391 family)
VVAAPWDSISILQAVDRHQEHYGGGAVSGVDGRQLMDEVAGQGVSEDGRVRGFVRELHIARDGGYLDFTVDDLMGVADQIQRSQPYQYLQMLRNFALTVAGQDRARGIRVVQPLPDPDEDDGRPISRLILDRVTKELIGEYAPGQLLDFLADGGLNILVDSRDDFPPELLYDILPALEAGSGDDRRLLRVFLGAWLDDRLVSGPTDEVRSTLVDQLARRGWHIRDSRLVIGEHVRSARVDSPLLRDARLAALHPEVPAVAGKLFKDGHLAAAVFETTKVITNRVKTMSGLTIDSGAGMMGAAFKDDKPAIVVVELVTQTGRDIQKGYRNLFMGLVSAVRNPAAHEQFASISTEDALELLGLCSHLMRVLDTASVLAAPTDPT